MMINENGDTALTRTRTKSQDKMLEYLLLNCHDKDTLTWYYTEDSVERMCKVTGWKVDNVNRILKELCDPKVGVLVKKTRGVYIISKTFFQTHK